MIRDFAYPIRKRIALPGHDYAGSPSGYFVTLRVHRGEHIFGEVVNGEMRLNALGKAVEEEWLRTAVLRSYVKLDAFIVMPNHFHAILDVIRKDQALGVVSELKSNQKAGRANGASPGTLGAIMGQFKNVTSKRCRALGHTSNHPLWQRRWHDRVIRSDSERADIRRYIWDNPLRWEQRRKEWTRS